MKIESVNLSEFLNHGDDRDHIVVKEEVVEDDGQGFAFELPTSEQSLKSMEDNFNLTQLPNNPPTLSPSTPSPSSMGKQKKPNEIKNNMSPMTTKKRPVSISGHAVPDHARKFCDRERVASNALNSRGEIKSSTMIRAEEVQSSLGTEFPSFVKLMVKSHVSSCFWMGVPMPFCESHLPKTEAIIILETESGDQYELKFLPHKNGLSAGWRNFATLHKLLVGDVLVFQLTEANKFKVYIIRANDSTEVDGALGLLNLDAHTKQNDADDRGTIALKNKKIKRSKSVPIAMVQKKKKKTDLLQYENDCELIGSKVLVDSKFSSSSVAFGDIKNFEDFKITVNRLHINSELPEHIWTKYYELCCSNNSFLHANLFQGLNCTLVTGFIIETVNISDAIRGCKLTTSLDEFSNWEKTLKSFELVGMDVGFLRARLHRLKTLAFESEGALKAKRYLEAKTQRVEAENRIRDLKAELVQLKEVSEKIDADIETLESEAESHELKFQKAVDTPW